MKVIDWVAILGAASWLPQIGWFILRLLTKPKLRLSPESAVEIGFGILGPNFNPSFAISTSRREALIEKMSIKIKHFDGDEHNFIWQLFDEKGFEGTSSKGEKIEMRRSQSASALKIGTVGLTERKIGFGDTTFKTKHSSLFGLLAEKDEVLFNADRANYPDNVFKSTEYNALQDFLKKGFYWKEGNYDVNIFVYEASTKTPHIEKFQFELNKVNISLIEKNIGTAQMMLKELYLIRAGKQQNFCPVVWNFAYPAIERAPE